MTLPPQLLARFQRLSIDPNTVVERFIRGAGPGGQKINKTSSTVVLVHLPSGAKVRCQAERSRTANRDQAWLQLIEKLEAKARSVTEATRQELEVERRRNRQKSYGQKVKMIQVKKHRARHRATRRRVQDE